jgi:hypothetical protein
MDRSAWPSLPTVTSLPSMQTTATFVETTPLGSQVAMKTIDTSGAGAGTLFGLAVAPNAAGVYFVDDGDNTLDFLH